VYCRCWQEIDALERKLSEYEKIADEQLVKLKAQNERLKAIASRKKLRAAIQAAFELSKRQMITARDLRYNEAKLQKMRQLKDMAEIELRLLDEELSESQKVEVNASS